MGHWGGAELAIRAPSLGGYLVLNCSLQKVPTMGGRSDSLPK